MFICMSVSDMKPGLLLPAFSLVNWQNEYWLISRKMTMIPFIVDG